MKENPHTICPDCGEGYRTEHACDYKAGRGIPWGELSYSFEEKKTQELEVERLAAKRTEASERDALSSFSKRRRQMFFRASDACGGKVAEVNHRSVDTPWMYELVGRSKSRVLICEHCAEYKTKLGPMFIAPNKANPEKYDSEFGWEHWSIAHASCVLPQGIAPWQWKVSR